MSKHYNRDPWKRLLANVKLSARYGAKGGSFSKYRKLPEKEVSLTVEDLREIFSDQDCRCHWMGIPLDPYDIFEKHHPLAMSVDRIDNDRGYTRDNVVICCRLMNLGRSCATKEMWENVIERLEIYGCFR